MPTPPPPDPPASIPQPIADYLRRLSLWAYQELDGKVPKAEAVPQLLLSASDQKPPVAVHALTINAAGAIAATAVTLGGGKP
jgi:hypothetical protein